MRLSIFLTIPCTFLVILHLSPGCHAFSSNDTKKESHFKRRIVSATVTSVLDFNKLSACSIFVDKTLLVRDFFNYTGSSQFQLITCPPKFAKTINLYMMKKFLRTSEDYSDSDESYSSENFKISPLLTSGDFFQDHANEYRMIYISFKNVRGDTYDKILNGLRATIKICYESYDWLYKDLRYHHTGAKLDSYKEFMNAACKGTIGEDDIARSLFKLSKILHETSKKEKIFLLMDDYDQPILSAIEHDANVTRVVGLMESLISQVLNADHSFVNYAIITGVHNVLDKGKFGNIKHYNFLSNHHFSEYFGFKEDEVVDLLKRHEIDAEETSRVIKYYDGYKVARTAKKIYNPWSIVKYLNNRDTSNGLTLENFWAETAERTNFIKYFQRNAITRDLLKELLSCKRIAFPLKKGFNHEDLVEMKRIIHEKGLNFVDYHADLFLSYLFHNGYLSHAGEPNTFVIPNLEIESYLGRSFVNKTAASFNKWKKLPLTCSVKGMLGKLWNRVFNN